MAEFERVKTRNEHGEPLCLNCGHAEYDHRNGSGLCLGLGAEKAALGSFCSCAIFQKPTDHFGRGDYSTWSPGTSSRNRAQFSQTSSRHEIGGRAGARPNLQHKKPGPGDGPAPEWIMFGVNVGTEVHLYASTSLSYMELRQEVGHFDELHQDLIKLGTLKPTPWDIKGRMVDYVIIVAPSYPEALAKLMQSGVWNYSGEPSTADLQRQAALEDARQAADNDRKMIEAPMDEIVDAEIIDDEEDG
jgi:hypothetical protein